jgi:hypothetical protein
MMFPIFEKYLSLDLPRGPHYWFEKREDKIILESDALKNPLISVYPYFSLDKENEWIYYDNKYIIHKVDNKLEKFECNDNLCKKSENIYYIFLDNKLEKIYKLKNKYLFNNNKYNKLEKRFKFILLIGKRKGILYINGEIKEIETPNSYYITKDYISLVYDGFTEIYDKHFNKTIKNFEAFFLGTTSIGEVYQTPSGRILINDNFAGICNSSYLIGELKGGIVLKCNDKVKLLRGTNAITISKNILENSSSAEDKFLLLGSQSATILLDDNLRNVLEMKPLNAAIIFDHKLISLSNNFYLGIINLQLKENIIKIINKINSYKRPIILSINYIKFPFNLNFNNNLILINKYINDENIIYEVEPTEFKPNKVKIVVDNDFIQKRVELDIDSDQPHLLINNAVLKVAKNGRIKGSDNNSMIELDLELKIPTRINSEIRVKFENIEKYHEIKNNKININIPLKYYKIGEENNVIMIELIRLNKPILRIEYPIKILFIDKPNKPNKVIETINDRKKIIKKIYNYDVFEWEEIEEYQVDYEDVIITKSGEVVSIDGKEVKVLPGISTYIFSSYSNISRKYYIIGIDDPIDKVSVELYGRSIKVKLHKKFNTISQIIYGFNTSISDEAEFNFDPLLDKIIVKSFLGNIKWVKEVRINGIRLGLILANEFSKKLQEYLETFGLV